MNLNVTMLVTIVVPLLVGVYTWNYGWWAWKQELRRGAIGLFLLAAATVGISGFTLWWNAR